MELLDDQRSARGLAAAIGRAIRSGALAEGDRLPPVREIAAQLAVSPTTVSDAWKELAASGAIVTRGRNGTFVRNADPVRAARRYHSVPAPPGALPIDLSHGTPDPALLPDLGWALGKAARQLADAPRTSAYADDPVDPELDAILRERWPYRPDSLTVVDGAMDALDRILCSQIRLGDRVVVENPTFPPLLDLLDVLGAEATPVGVDHQGPLPDELAAALALGSVRAVVLQPRAHNPTGASITPERLRQLAEVLAGHPDVLVVEDDHSGDIASSDVVSLGTVLPDRVVTVLGFSKSHGPDLRLAAIGGAATVIDGVASRRLIGPGWSSRLLQAALVHLLTGRTAQRSVERARQRYARRRADLTDALSTRGLDLPEGDGFNLWVPVGDESNALVALAARGIAVAPGTPFQCGRSAPHIRVTIATLDYDVSLVADAVAAAAERAPARRSV